MRLAPLLLLLLPLGLVLLQLLLRWGLQRRSELLRSARTTHRPLQRQEPPIAVEVDVDSSPLFVATAPTEAPPYYLVFDTETQDVLHEEEEGHPHKNQELALSPLILLSWQVLDESGSCLTEETHLIRRSCPITPEATALHHITTEQMDQEGEELHSVLLRFLEVAAACQVLVAHHLRFHRSLLFSELDTVGLPKDRLEALRTLCTSEGASWASSAVPRAKRLIPSSANSSATSTCISPRSTCASARRGCVMSVSVQLASASSSSNSGQTASGHPTICGVPARLFLGTTREAPLPSGLTSVVSWDLAPSDGIPLIYRRCVRVGL